MRAEHLVNQLSARRRSGRLSCALALPRRKDDFAERVEEPDRAERIEPADRGQVLHDVDIPQRTQSHPLKDHARAGNPEFRLQFDDLDGDAPPAEGGGEGRADAPTTRTPLTAGMR